MTSSDALLSQPRKRGRTRWADSRGRGLRMKSKSRITTEANSLGETGRRPPANRPPTHPGEMLLEEFLRPLGITLYNVPEICVACVAATGGAGSHCSKRLWIGARSDVVACAGFGSRDPELRI